MSKHKKTRQSRQILEKELYELLDRDKIFIKYTNDVLFPDEGTDVIISPTELIEKCKVFQMTLIKSIIRILTFFRDYARRDRDDKIIVHQFNV